MNKKNTHNPITPELVNNRLNNLYHWQSKYLLTLRDLDIELLSLSEDELINGQFAISIAQLKRLNKMELIPIPFEIDKKMNNEIGFEVMLEKFNHEYSTFSKKDQLIWLNNLLFVLTPEIKRLYKKLEYVKEQKRLGQSRNFLIGGNSGMGKSTLLDWYLWKNKPSIDTEMRRNLVPIIKIDAPVDDKSGKPLLTRIINFCGKTATEKLNYQQLLSMIVLYIQICSTEMIIIDEIEHIKVHTVKRRILEISNLSPGIPIVCASCRPKKWTNGDVEIQGRWNDSFTLSQYTGDKLKQLLIQIEMMLPFPKPSFLWLAEFSQNGEMIEGPLNLIEEWTGGILRDIMALIIDASKNSIEENLSNISIHQLKLSWENIQEEKVLSFLDENIRL